MRSVLKDSQEMATTPSRDTKLVYDLTQWGPDQCIQWYWCSDFSETENQDKMFDAFGDIDRYS